MKLVDNDIKLKVCGMKHIHNILQVAALQPDYMGFIFYEKSQRNVYGTNIDDLNMVPSTITKTAVFVNEPIQNVENIVKKYDFGAVQLHGDESTEYVQRIRTNLPLITIIKTFGIYASFDSAVIDKYANIIDYLLFDTKGIYAGGNGKKFDWDILCNININIPYFISGGISADDAPNIHALKKKSHMLYAADINSMFETDPGMKDVNMINRFKTNLKNHYVNTGSI
ncbi:MAG: phosphoribosylanthranilate isomerase [Cytophagales bacterium]|nr:phosphoribosylanthranilate isomerase [Cytophagales bacterium]